MTSGPSRAQTLALARRLLRPLLRSPPGTRRRARPRRVPPRGQPTRARAPTRSLSAPTARRAPA
eukprot:3569672-Pyramimonas_sp.AAC.1